MEGRVLDYARSELAVDENIITPSQQEGIPSHQHSPRAASAAERQPETPAANSNQNCYSFEQFWKIKKDPNWEIVAASKRAAKTNVLPSPQARSRPLIWSETWHDAQDALPYFSVGQTILTSKIPRVQSRCVLLTRNLDNIKTCWKRGKIEFSVHLKYKFELTRPKHWKPLEVPAGFIPGSVPNPPEPLQFRKLRACCDAGTPVKLLATGDFPSLPTVDSAIGAVDGNEIRISSDLWRNGIVVLGFFWVMKAEEINPKSLSDNVFDIHTGKCSGEAVWRFEFKTCEKPELLWWHELGFEEDPCEVKDHPAKKPRRLHIEELLNEVPIAKTYPMEVDQSPIGMHDTAEAQVYIQPQFPWAPNPNSLYQSDFPLDPSLVDARIEIPMNMARTYPHALELSNNPTPIEVSMHHGVQFSEHPEPPRHTMHCDPPSSVDTHFQPEQLGLTLYPKSWPLTDAIRPPQIRSSMLLGWYCSTCGKLNPRVKWVEAQVCPLCESVTFITFPKWHRKAHTEAVGPIGTFYRLDDGGGHVHRTGLHAKTGRDPETGMTIVKYWTADPPIPILAEIGRVKPTPRTRRGGLPRPAPRPSQLGAPLSTASPMGGNPPLPGTLAHPKIERDVAGSRGRLPGDTRVLFVHVTRPQHEHLMAVPDRIFSEFASMVPMERQVNTKQYRAGQSTLSCHYTYLAGVGSSILHTSTPAVGWDQVPNCVYNAQRRLTDMQRYNVGKDDEQDTFNQSVFVVGSGGIGVNSFRMVHRAEDGPVGYMVFGASCEVELIIGNGQGKRTSKADAQRRTEMLMAHGDAMFTAPPESGDPPIEVRVKRTGLAIVVVSRYVEEKPAPALEPESPSAMEGVVYESGASSLKPPAKARKRKSRG
ncbi:hypothetical protein RhiJN_25781 [Ceratobasidium sp. AG-Ba]|nr:hypothetical protein RhiJN_25781 [Ceratobasidium sp. AG-Ba]